MNGLPTKILELLALHQPGAHALLRDHDAAPALDGPAAAAVDCEQLRAATVVYLGVDSGLPQLLESLDGEVNVLIVEPDPGRAAAALSLVERPAVADPRRVRWVLSEALLEELDLADFCLAGIKVVTAPRREPTPLDLAAMRRITETLDEVQRRRLSSDETWFTMVTYDRLALTRLTLDRLAINTDAAMKLVIIDNASSDGTRRWLRKNAHRYPFIDKIVLMDRNLGIGRALNNGLLYCMSRGRRVGRLDNDILVPPFWLRDLNHVLDSPLGPKVVCGLVTDDPVVKEIVAHGQAALVDDLKVYLVETIGGCCNVYDPAIFSDLGFFPEEPLYGVEDGGLCKAVRDAGQTIAVVDNVKLEHLSTLFPDAQEYLSFKGDQLDVLDAEQPDGGGFGLAGAAGRTGDRGKLGCPGKQEEAS